MYTITSGTAASGQRRVRHSGHVELLGGEGSLLPPLLSSTNRTGRMRQVSKSSFGGTDRYPVTARGTVRSTGAVGTCGLSAGQTVQCSGADLYVA